MMRIASYNVENLFERPKAFGSDNADKAKAVLAAYEEVNRLIKKAQYTAADKTRLLELLVILEICAQDEEGKVTLDTTFPPAWAWLRENHGRLLKDTDDGIKVVAKGRDSWVGWIELATEAVREKPTLMTARVIKDVNPDILAVVEAEHRPSLMRFNEQLLGGAYKHVMLVDGNDERGIDVGLMTKANFPIGTIDSNVDLEDDEGVIFSRDCPQYQVKLGDKILHILVNHFKSQTKGADGDTGGGKRFRQATAVRTIVNRLVQAGEHVIVVGDLNEGPNAGFEFAKNLEPLYNDDTPLVDCWKLPQFNQNGAPGSWRWSDLRNRLDYILLSKSLVEHVESGGVFRKGLWHFDDAAGNWDMYPEIERADDAASDHGLLFVDLNL